MAAKKKSSRRSKKTTRKVKKVLKVPDQRTSLTEVLANRHFKSVARDSFHEVGPFKIVPGVQGRAEWFTERFGLRPDSSSLERLECGIQCAEEMLDPDTSRARALDDARTLMRKAKLKPGARIRSARAVDATGRRVTLRTSRTRKKTGWSSIGKPLQVSEFEGAATLYLPVDEKVAARLDLEQVIVAEVSDPTNPRLIDSFSYWANERAIVGRVRKPGTYQAFAFPKDPWIKTAFMTLCYYWKWVQYDPRIRELGRRAGGRGGRIEPGIVDRICHLILCAADYRNINQGDIGVFHEMGVGVPPGFKGTGRRAEPIPGDFGGLGGDGNLCERCLGDFIGELDVVRDVIVMPPIIKWCWFRRPRCTRWQSLGPEPQTDFRGIGRVTQMDVHPTDGDTLIAGAAAGGVWRTDNGGDSWRPMMELEPTLTIGAVAIAPSNPSVMYAGSGEDGGGWNPAWRGVGIYRTTNGGGDWDLMANVPSTGFSAIVVHPTDADTIYVAGDQGLHKTTDGGQTWITNLGLMSLFDGRVTDVVIAHDDPNRIYIGVRNDGVYRSTTGGEAGLGAAFTRLDGVNQLPSGFTAGWIKLSIGKNGASGSDYVVTKMADQGSRIFRTQNAGNTWTELAANVATVSFDEWASVIAVDPNDEDIMYAGAASSLVRTTNGGANAGDWTSIFSGTHSDQQDLCFDPGNSSRVFLANDGGVFRSTNRGTNWTFTSTNLRITQLYDIDISEKDRDVCAGGAQDNGVYYRNTSGQWDRIPWGDGTQTAIDPTDPNIFYFSSQNGVPNWLRRSVDGGASHQALGTTGLSGGSPWVTIIKLDPQDPIANPANNRIVFVCGSNQLFRSTDGGQNWQRVEDGGGAPFVTAGTITALEFAPSDSSVLYLGTSNGSVYRGVNGGVTTADWTRIDTLGSPADALFPNVQIQGLRVHAKDPSHVWLVFGGAGVGFTARPNMILNPLGISHLFKTMDGGVTWTDASGRFPAMSLPDVPTSAVALDDVTDEVAYCGTDVGVFRTTDGGETWQSFQDGLPRVPVAELRLNRRWSRLFVGTMGRGVFVRDV